MSPIRKNLPSCPAVMLKEPEELTPLEAADRKAHIQFTTDVWNYRDGDSLFDPEGVIGPVYIAIRNKFTMTDRQQDAYEERKNCFFPGD